MSVHPISAQAAMERMGRGPQPFSDIVDARSEDEYALDHLPGAVNWPSLDNQQRIFIGTMYKQVNPFEAQKRGAALVARNIAAHIERELIDTPKSWQPLVYCWRGGKRSGALAIVLGQIGFKVFVVEGGYKAFRAAVLQDIPRWAGQLSYRVVCGPTGAGKTRLLAALRRQGAQVLDLEALASHRSSVLGQIPGVEQPSPKRFDTLLWNALRGFDPARPVFIEAESKKVGNLAIPDSLMEAMRASPCIDLQMSDDERVALLMEDYDFFVRDPQLFGDRLNALVELRGRAVVQSWKDRAAAGDAQSVVRELLTTHYDPGYAQSVRRNFRQYEGAFQVVAQDGSAQSMDRLARELIGREPDALEAQEQRLT